MELHTKILDYFHDPIVILDNDVIVYSNKIFKETFEKNVITIINPSLLDHGIKNIYLDDKYYELNVSIIDNNKIVVFKDLTIYQDVISELNEYKEFFDESDVAFMRCDLKTGKMILGNLHLANLIGFPTVEGLKDFCFFRCFSKECKQKFMSLLRKKKKIDKYQFELIKTDGSTVWVEGDFHINCGVTCIEGYIHNISEKKKLEKELEHLQELNSKNMEIITLKLEQLSSAQDSLYISPIP